MQIAKATKQYEAWLEACTTVVHKDLDHKHEAMAQNAFAFLRGTFYRWAQRWPKLCPNLAAAPPVLAVGDPHVENFGTWRDSEGRLIWGVNDFDEASTMAYTNDLVRLATSVSLARQGNHLRVDLDEACEAVLAGYSAQLDQHGQPFVLDNWHAKLRAMAHSDLRAPGPFWETLNGLPTLKKSVPASAVVELEEMLPEARLRYHIAHRVAGLGSLGHERYVALAEWRGGHVAREAKALVPSACLWAGRTHGPVEILYQGDNSSRGTLSRSYLAGPGTVDRATAGAGLLGNRSGVVAYRPRRAALPHGDGSRGGKHAPWLRCSALGGATRPQGPLAALLLRALFGTVGHLGATLPHHGQLASVVMETLLTGLLLTVILATATDHHLVGHNAALAVSGIIALDGLFAAPISGASMNPARSFGPALLDGQLGTYWIYLAGPFAGATLAVILAWLLRGGTSTDAMEAAQGHQ